MPILKRTLTLTCCAIILAGCGAAPANDATNVVFSDSFLPLERGAGGTSWRWMAEEGTIQLPNTKRDMHLLLVGRVPSEVSAPPTITLELNGEPLDRIENARGEIHRDYDVPSARLGEAATVTLRLTSDKTFTPKDLNPQSPDDRHLSFAVYDLQWTPR